MGGALLTDTDTLDELPRDFKRATSTQLPSMPKLDTLRSLLDSFHHTSHVLNTDDRPPPSLSKLRSVLGSFESEGVFAQVRERRSAGVLGIFGLRMAESHLSRGLGFLFNERRPAGQLL